MSVLRKYGLPTALFLLALFLAWSWSQPQLPKRIRAGYFNFLPYMIVSADNVPRGFLIDSFEEVARRRGFAVDWVNTTGQIEAALTSGRVDIYPQLLITPGRQQQFAFSEPWWETTLVLVSPADRAVLDQDDLKGKKISVFSGSHTASLVAKLFPRSTQLPTRANDTMLLPLCTGKVNAAIAESRAMNLLLARADRPCPGMTLHIQPFPQLTLKYGVATRKPDVWLAHEMQTTLLDMNMDGAFNQIGSRWNVYSTNQIGMFRDLVRFKNQRLWLIASIGLLLAALAGVYLLYYRMKQARLEALNASRMQSRFLANMSHEIRTPLNGILGMSSLLASTRLEPVQYDYLDAISSSGEVLLALINDCLDLAKIESGKFQLEAIDYSLESIVELVTQVIGPKARLKGLAIASYVDPQIPPTLSGDPNRIQQILFNLLGNALKFTQKGEIWIEVKLLSPGLIRFSVDDTGPGVPPEARAHLFERFTQADTSTTRKFGGTGLGLAIVRELVHLMNGDIGQNPSPSGGSCFWFTLPIEPKATPPLPHFHKTVAIKNPDPATRRLLDLILPQWGCTLVEPSANPDLLLDGPDWLPPIRQSRLRLALHGVEMLPIPAPKTVLPALGLNILVAEDNLVNQRLALSFLGKLGCVTDLVEDGEQAVAAAAKKSYDLILMDYQMPVLDGLSATRRIRASSGPESKTPIIAVTAGIMALNRDQIVAAGFNDILPKPYSLDALRAILNAHRPQQSPVTAA